jgi:hypothetical protein
VGPETKEAIQVAPRGKEIAHHRRIQNWKAWVLSGNVPIFMEGTRNQASTRHAACSREGHVDSKSYATARLKGLSALENRSTTRSVAFESKNPTGMAKSSLCLIYGSNRQNSKRMKTELHIDETDLDGSPSELAIIQASTAIDRTTGRPLQKGQHQ